MKIQIYFYDIFGDFVFKFPGDNRYWMSSDSGKIWYAIVKTPRFELVAEL
jgi:hypothetical protein